VKRTLPNHFYFQREFEQGQNDLFSVLNCISITVPEVGYVQGMGYMVAILLIQMDKADAFNVMRHILTSPPYEMMDFFTNEMKGLKRMLYVFMRLLLRLMPKLYYHL